MGVEGKTLTCHLSSIAAEGNGGEMGSASYFYASHESMNGETSEAFLPESSDELVPEGDRGKKRVFS